MRKKRTLLIVAIVLVVESVAIVLLPLKSPRPVRVLTAAVNLIMVAALWLLARQQRPD